MSKLKPAKKIIFNVRILLNQHFWVKSSKPPCKLHFFILNPLRLLRKFCLLTYSRYDLRLGTMPITDQQMQIYGFSLSHQFRIIITQVEPNFGINNSKSLARRSMDVRHTFVHPDSRPATPHKGDSQYNLIDHWLARVNLQPPKTTIYTFL